MYAATILCFSILPTFIVLWIAYFEDQRTAPTPLLIIGVAILFGFTLKGVYLAYTEWTGAYHRLNYASAGIIDIGVLASFLGIMAFLLGYGLTKRIGSPRTSVTLLPERNGVSPALLHWGLFSVSLALMVIYFFQMGFAEQIATLQFSAKKKFELETGETTALAFLTVGGEFLTILMLYYIVLAKRIRPTHPLILAILFCCLCWFLASRRNAVMIVMALVLLVIGARAVKSRLRAAFIRNVLLAAGLAILSLVAIIRSEGGTQSASELSLRGGIATSLEQTFSGSYFMDPAKTAIIVETFPERLPFLHGRTYLEFVIAPIPRAIWPEKPDVRNSYFVAEEVLDLRTNSGVPPSGLAEFYMNFGWPGIVLGMFLTGVLSAWLYRRYRTAPNPQLARIPYATAMICIALFMLVDYTMAVLFFIRYQIAIYVGARYWMARMRRDLGMESVRQQKRTMKPSYNFG